MLNAYEKGNAADRAAARKQMANVIKKMPTETLAKYASSASDGAYFSQKGMGPKSEYSKWRHDYMVALSKTYHAELAKRK